MKNELIKSIFIKDGKVTTTSLAIAKDFQKKHKNVTQLISKLECSKEFGRLNYKPVSYIDSHNRKQPMYEITLDGFTFLAMGFTGQRASEFKEKYINVFNSMETQLRTAKQITKIDLAKMVIESEEARIKLEKENKVKQLLIEEQAPKAANYDLLLNSKKKFKMSEFANITYAEFGLGQNNMFKLLRELEILMDNEIRWNTPYQKYIDKEYFDVIEKETMVDGDGFSVFTSVTLVTSKGADYLIKKIRKHFNNNK